MPRRSVGQMRDKVSGWFGARSGLGQQVDSIVDSLADQRHAEAQGDAVHEAERHADSGNPGEHSARHRQERKHQNARGAIGEQQDGRNQCGGDQRQPRHVRLHARARPYGKHRRAGFDQPGLGGGRPIRGSGALPGGGKRGLDPVEGLFLRIDIEACCNSLDHQERTALVG